MLNTVILKKLENNDLHVHAISRDEKLPIPVWHWMTHYIMKDSEIVFAGNLDSLNRWVLGNF